MSVRCPFCLCPECFETSFTRFFCPTCGSSFELRTVVTTPTDSAVRAFQETSAELAEEMRLARQAREKADAAARARFEAEREARRKAEEAAAAERAAQYAEQLAAWQRVHAWEVALQEGYLGLPEREKRIELQYRAAGWPFLKRKSCHFCKPYREPYIEPRLPPMREDAPEEPAEPGRSARDIERRLAVIEAFEEGAVWGKSWPQGALAGLQALEEEREATRLEEWDVLVKREKNHKRRGDRGKIARHAARKRWGLYEHKGKGAET